MTIPGVPLPDIGTPFQVGPAHVTQLGWALIGIFLLIVLASAAPRMGGAIIVLVVISMVYAAHNRNPPLI